MFAGVSLPRKPLPPSPLPQDGLLDVRCLRSGHGDTRRKGGGNLDDNAVKRDEDDGVICPLVQVILARPEPGPQGTPAVAEQGRGVNNVTYGRVALGTWRQGAPRTLEGGGPAPLTDYLTITTPHTPSTTPHFLTPGSLTPIWSTPP